MTSHQEFDLAVPVSAVDHVLGVAHASVTVVEYGDFECPNCKQAAPTVKLLLERFADRVRLVYRHFPLEGVHPHALLAAQAAEAAGGQGEFWKRRCKNDPCAIRTKGARETKDRTLPPTPTSGI